MTDLLAQSMAWMDELWDDDGALLWTVTRDRHMTRDTAWYALGLLQRRDGEDARRAGRAIDAVIDQQLSVPGAPFDGTFRRAPEEPDPPAEPVMWIHYDPNWRQFIGTTFAVMCDRFADDLPRQVVARMRTSIARAVEGEPEDRVSADYSNIALMKAWLDEWSGHTDRAVTFAREIASRFVAHSAFLEYNSPTYYGIDLWALALWRSSTSALAAIGATIEDALWRDVARFYHAGLRNLCGPHDRAYGMDMTQYATPLGLWISSVVGAEHAPFPNITGRFHHPHDLCFAPCVTAVETAVPADVRTHLMTFTGPRTIETTISTEPLRVATAWLDEDVMFGGQSGPASGIGWLQHHHATAHWRRPDGGVGWARLRPDVAADATVAPGELRISTRSMRPIVFDVHPPPAVDGRGWTIDGRSLSVETNAGACTVADGGAVSYDPADASTSFVIRA